MTIIYAPHITAPLGGEVYNLGTISITWDANDPPTDDEYGVTSIITYEIEYTDHYIGHNTIWNTIKRRIPWTESSYDWVVGKMIKSETVRVRIRARNSVDGSVSDWSMIGTDFSVNVFKLYAPAIVSPQSRQIYTDFILIILDETLTQNTYHQKVRYSLEYNSQKLELDWTTIASNLPVGQNVIRWNLDDVTPSDDYVLRLTASDPQRHQISRQYIYDLQIQQPGMFYIDTLPPQTVLELENNLGITNELVHTLNIYAEDATTDVEQIQIRECDTTSQIALGNTELTSFGATPCTPIEQLISGNNADFGQLIGKPLSYSTKTQWVFDDQSGLRRIEALVTDSGGNTSLQELSKTFIPIFKTTATINDMIVVREQRVYTSFNADATGCQISISSDAVLYEVAYLVLSDGSYWSLEPFAKLISDNIHNRDVKRLCYYQGLVLIFTYTNNNSIIDEGAAWQDDKSIFPQIYEFPHSKSVVNAISEFDSVLYCGLENGELWSYNGVAFTLVQTFSDPISSLSGDNQYLYIGYSNSASISIYDGSQFYTSTVEF